MPVHLPVLKLVTYIMYQNYLLIEPQLCNYNIVDILFNPLILIVADITLLFRYQRVTDQHRPFMLEQTLKFIKIVESPKRQTRSNSLNRSKFKYAKAMQFRPEQFDLYPKWLTSRDEFVPFMYKNYQEKLLIVPNACEKTSKTLEERSLILAYLQKVDLFRDLPSLVLQVLLNSIRPVHYRAGQTIHEGSQCMEGIGIVYVGVAEEQHPNKKVKKLPGQVIMQQAFYQELHPSIVALEPTVVLMIPREAYALIQEKLREDNLNRYKNQILDLLCSDFFVSLHLKDRRAWSFFIKLKPQFYFRGVRICEANTMANKFYIHFRGNITEQNSIYIREHNKWPLPNNRWEVRAVYNSYQNQTPLKPFSFFGDEEIIGNLKFKSTLVTQTHAYLYSLPAETFKKILSPDDFKRLKKYRNQNLAINYGEFQMQVRHKIRSEHERKKIVHKAINSSFTTGRNMGLNKLKQIVQVEKSMLSPLPKDSL